MALIDCPECGNQISEQASICPNCGFKIGKYKAKRRIENSAITIKQKIKTAFQNIIVKNKKISISIVIAGTSAFCIFLGASAIYDYYDRLAYERDVFNYVSDNKYEPFALTTDNNIIGKEIPIVLEEHFKDKSFSFRQDDNFRCYTFSEQFEYPAGTDSTLTICADVNFNLVNMIDYSFYLKDLTMNSSRAMLSRLKQELTMYYKVNPTLAYTNAYGELVPFPEEDFTIFMRDNKYNYYIFWEVDELTVMLYVPNATDYGQLKCRLLYMNKDVLGSNEKYLQCNNTGGTTVLRKDTASQANCIISGVY